MAEPLLQVSNLRKLYPAHRRRPEIVAVDDVSFHLEPRECLALVGESGSGKSTRQG